jgi:hypothetical protein
MSKTIDWNEYNTRSCDRDECLEDASYKLFLKCECSNAPIYECVKHAAETRQLIENDDLTCCGCWKDVHLLRITNDWMEYT